MTEAHSGAHVLLATAQLRGIRVCFANPGTTELALVRALDDVPGIRAVLGLFEGVCTGAADGYARICGLPALTLLHLGPGLANGLANLHNARRANSPVINIVGDHASWHLAYDAPLTSDIEGLARPVSGKVIRLSSPDTTAAAVCEAFEAAMTPPRSVVTLIAPSDLVEELVTESRKSTAPPNPPPSPRTVPSERISDVAARLDRQGCVLLLGAEALSERGQRAANRIASATGARLFMQSYPAIALRGGDLPRLERLAYFPQDVRAQLREDLVILAGALAPVSYFGYAGEPSELVDRERLITLSAPGEDGALALEELADRLAAPLQPKRSPAESEPTKRDSRLTSVEIAEELVSQLPEDAVVSLEGSTCGAPFLQRAHRARRHWVMTNTGGAIGQGIPCGLGAAIGRPGSRVICLQSDGSAQYTVQALWTLAREQLNVTVIICANHRYGILQTELQRAGARLDGPATAGMTRLDTPRLDWVSLARGYGVPGRRVTTAADFRGTLQEALRSTGPNLIECELP